MTGGGRGQNDIPRLLGFILAITALLVVVPFVFGVAGIDIRDSSVGDTGDSDSGELEDGSLVILSTFGTSVNDDRTTVGVVEVLVAASGEDVVLDDVTVTWDGGDRYELAPAFVGSADSSFGVETFRGETTLAPGEKAMLRFDVETDDIDDVPEFGDRLEPGDTLTIRITTGQGAETTTTVTVPNPLPEGTAVRFD
jgi:archaellin